MFLARHRRNRAPAALLLCVTLAALAVSLPPASAMTRVLYDGAAGGTPDTQDMIYLATGEGFITPPVAAAQSYDAAAALTALKTDAAQGDFAGYSPAAAVAPTLDRTLGFTLTFTVKIVSQVNSSDDRAGFSVLLLGADMRGIELGFWEDQIWAQDDDQLFKRAEHVATNTQRLVSYDLAVLGETYTLRGGGATLSGRLRSYRASPYPPYHTPSMIYLGDNSSRGGAHVEIARVAVTLGGPRPTATSTPAATATATASPTATSTPTRTASPTATPSPTDTLTATLTPSATASATATSAPGLTPTPTATQTRTPTVTATRTLTPTASATATPTLTGGVDAHHTLWLPLLANL